MLELTEHGSVTVVKMQYGKANAQDVEFCRELARCFEELDQSNTRAIVLTGQGSIFSAGVDLVRLSREGATYVKEFLPALVRMFQAVFFCSKPVVSAVNGHAIAGGCILACCADYRLMAQDKGRIGVPELLVGVPFPAAALEVMRYACAPQYLEEVIYTGATFGAEEARLRGLVHAAVEPAQLLDETLKMANHLAALPPAAFALTKKQIRANAAGLGEKGTAIDAAAFEQWASPETLAAIQSYIERTFSKGGR